MFVGCRVEHQFGKVFGEDGLELAFVQDIGWEQRVPAELECLQLFVKLVKSGFVVIQEHDSFRLVTGNLPDQLGAYRAAGSGNQDPLAGYVVGYGEGVDLDLGSVEQVGDFQVSETRWAPRVTYQVGDTRRHLDRYPGSTALDVDVGQLLGCGGGDGNDDL
ncbi:MAG: hypothetical protein BWY79_01094 [Actinobacteria bacterium ADurb.Bin444]|nr:MAG: hypothetical protein BWY79_01094 [Actinobacteria bacterium ADurb.Bin444]